MDLSLVKVQEAVYVVRKQAYWSHIAEPEIGSAVML